MSEGDRDSLRRHLIWLYGDEHRCRCDHAYVSMGKLHGIMMGKGWVRTTTHPDCPEHGTVASKARAERIRAANREYRLGYQRGYRARVRALESVPSEGEKNE